MFGGDTPNLQKLTLHIVSQCCSSNGCERNWSTFALIHTKVRNKLSYKKIAQVGVYQLQPLHPFEASQDLWTRWRSIFQTNEAFTLWWLKSDKELDGEWYDIPYKLGLYVPTSIYV
jgi:hypothetical protein